MKKIIFIFFLLTGLYPSLQKGKLMVSTNAGYAQDNTDGVEIPELCITLTTEENLSGDGLFVFITKCTVAIDCETKDEIGERHGCSTTFELVPQEEEDPDDPNEPGDDEGEPGDNGDPGDDGDPGDPPGNPGDPGNPPQPPQPPDNPCSSANKNAGINASKPLNESQAVIDKLAAARSQTTSDGKETGFNIGTNSDGEYDVDYLRNNGTAHNVNIVSDDTDSLDIWGKAHTHTEDNPPSAADLYELADSRSTNANFTNSYILGPNSTYALIITDPTKFNSYLTANPRSTRLNTATNNFVATGTAIGDEFYNIYHSIYNGGIDPISNPTDAQKQFYRQEAYTAAMARILSQYNAGVGLYKLASDGKLKPITTSKSADENFKTTYTASGCN